MRQHRFWRNLTRILGVITLFCFLIVNTMGFVDTETGSAFGCGKDWPLCNGSVLPKIWGMQTIIEFAHRGLVAVATVFLLVWIVLAWIVYGKSSATKFLSLASLFFVFLEAFLGAMGVLFADPPPILAIHFGVSVLAFVAVFLLHVHTGQLERHHDADGQLTRIRPLLPSPNLRSLVWVLFAYTYLAMYVGAYVASSGDGGMFRGWPIPTESYSMAHGALTVDWLHRSIAIVLVAALVGLVIKTRRTRLARLDLYKGSVWALIFVVIQAISGAILIVTHLRMWAFMIHVTVVTFLFTAIAYLAMQVTLSQVERSLSHRSRRI